MSYLSDKEKRLLFSALTREKKVCEEVDKEACHEPYETPLKRIVEGLERKFYYDRFEREIRDKAIDEYTKRLKENIQLYTLDAVFETSSFATYSGCTDIFWKYVDEIAKQMKEIGE